MGAVLQIDEPQPTMAKFVN